jgi:DNA-binding beta-propeller fold protein YncE
MILLHMRNFVTLGSLLILLTGPFLSAPWSTPAAGPGSPHQPELLVVNQTDHSVSFIDPSHPRPAATLDEAAITGHEIAVTPDGRTAFVPIYGNSGVGKPGTDGRTVEIIDVGSRKLIHTLDFGHGVRPHCAVYDRKRNLLYVTTELDQTLAIVDPVTYEIVGRIPTGQAQSHMLALSHDGRFGYTANVEPGTVSVLDLEKRKIIAVIPISPNTQRIAVSGDDRFVFTADQTKPQLVVIDTATNSVKHRIDLPAIAYGTASTTDGRWLLATMRPLGAVALIDARTHTFVRAIKTGGIPTEILIRPDGNVAYVSCGSNVVAIDLTTMEVAGTLNAGAGADGLAWAD